MAPKCAVSTLSSHDFTTKYSKARRVLENRTHHDARVRTRALVPSNDKAPSEATPSEWVAPSSLDSLWFAGPKPGVTPGVTFRSAAANFGPQSRSPLPRPTFPPESGRWSPVCLFPCRTLDHPRIASVRGNRSGHCSVALTERDPPGRDKMMGLTT